MPSPIYDIFIHPQLLPSHQDCFFRILLFNILCTIRTESTMSRLKQSKQPLTFFIIQGILKNLFTSSLSNPMWSYFSFSSTVQTQTAQRQTRSGANLFLDNWWFSWNTISLESSGFFRKYKHHRIFLLQISIPLFFYHIRSLTSTDRLNETICHSRIDPWKTQSRCCCRCNPRFGIYGFINLDTGTWLHQSWITQPNECCTNYVKNLVKPDSEDCVVNYACKQLGFVTENNNPPFAWFDNFWTCNMFIYFASNSRINQKISLFSLCDGITYGLAGNRGCTLTLLSPTYSFPVRSWCLSDWFHSDNWSCRLQLLK